MSKDIGMGVHKGHLFLPGFVAFWRFHPYMPFNLIFFVTLSYINRTNLGAIASQSYVLKYVAHLYMYSDL